jgi:hypothetical protein
MTQPTGPYTAIQPTSLTLNPATIHDGSTKTEGQVPQGSKDVRVRVWVRAEGVSWVVCRFCVSSLPPTLPQAYTNSHAHPAWYS